MITASPVRITPIHFRFLAQKIISVSTLETGSNIWTTLPEGPLTSTAVAVLSADIRMEFLLLSDGKISDGLRIFMANLLKSRGRHG